MISFCPLLFKVYVIFVSCDYVKTESSYEFVSVNQALEIANKQEAFLPNTELVDYIYNKASCKITSKPKDPSDPTSKDRQNKEIEKNIKACPTDSLVAGQLKSITRKDDIYGLYGWRDKEGKLIQNFYAGHDYNYSDYSHGLRLIKKLGYNIITLTPVDIEAILYKRK